MAFNCVYNLYNRNIGNCFLALIVSISVTKKYLNNYLEGIYFLNVFNAVGAIYIKLFISIFIIVSLKKCVVTR